MKADDIAPEHLAGRPLSAIAAIRPLTRAMEMNKPVLYRQFAIAVYALAYAAVLAAIVALAAWIVL